MKLYLKIVENICAFVFNFSIFMTSINITRPLILFLQQTVTFQMIVAAEVLFVCLYDT